MSNTLTLNGVHEDDTIVRALPPSWYAEMLAGFSDTWATEADGSWLVHDPEDV